MKSSTILHYYGGSLLEALKTVYSDKPWASDDRRTMVDGAISRSQFRMFTVVKVRCLCSWVTPRTSFTTRISI